MVRSLDLQVFGHLSHGHDVDIAHQSFRLSNEFAELIEENILRLARLRVWFRSRLPVLITWTELDQPIARWSIPVD